MSEGQEFGTKLRALRTKAGLSLRELADKVGVDFTYLSKIENGALPPPSEKVIRQLAETLNIDKDELLALAGKIPSDIAEILKEPGTLEKLRAGRARKEAATANQGTRSVPKTPMTFKGLSRLALPVFLVIAVASSLWYALPTKALDVNFPSLPATGTIGSAYTFTVKVSIADQELLPIRNIDLYIYRSASPTTYRATCSALPLTSTTKYYTSTQTGGGAVTVTATATNLGWNYGYGYAFWEPESTSHYFGYGYGYGGTLASITYLVTWVSPTTWLDGAYKAELKITADSTDFTKTSGEFTLSARPTVVGGGGGGGAPLKKEKTAKDLEDMTAEEAAREIEELTAAKAAAVIEDISTEKAADIIEEITADMAADIIEEITARKAVDIIAEVTTRKAADIIEEMTTRKAADIIAEIDTRKAADIIGNLTIPRAVAVLENVGKGEAAAIMEQLSLEKLTDMIGAMSEPSLTGILPGLSLSRLYSIDPAVLFAALPSAPTEQLVSEQPPQPPAGLGNPVSVYATPAGAKYLTLRTMAGEWVVVMGTPEPVDKLMIKTDRALQNVGTTLEITGQQPPEVLMMLPAGQIARAYITISFENMETGDIALGYMTFKVEKEWLEQNSIHPWSVALRRYDPDLNRWITLPTRRVNEDDSCVYYSAAITHFSVFAISGSPEVPPPTFQTANFEISPAEASSGESVTISAAVTNTSDRASTYAATLWINGTIEAGKDISIAAGGTEPVSFTVNPVTEGDYNVRIDRLFGNFDIGKPAPGPAPAPEPVSPAPEPAPPVPQPTPAPAPAPPVTPEIPVTPTNWWLIGGIMIIVLILGAVTWQLVARRRQ